MKKIIIVLCFLLLTACGGQSSAGGNTSGSSSQASGKDEIVFNEPKVIVDNEYVTVKLISFSQEMVNWADGEQLEKYFTVKVTNNTDREIGFSLYTNDTYIDDEGVECSSSDGNVGPKPGKTMSFTYRVSRDGKALDSMDELYGMNGAFTVSVKSADGKKIEKQEECPFDFK